MAYKTFGELNTQLQKELDLQGEDFISDSEMIGIWNRAVSVAEAHLITLGLKDKYFLGRDTISLVSGTEEYALPSTIFGNKIIKVIYRVGSDFYVVSPLESSTMFEDYEFIKNFSTSEEYKYLITHSTPATQKFLLVPPSRITQSAALTLWFSRSANRYAVDADVCDFPDICYEFLSAFVKEKCYEKESHVNYDGAKADRMEKEQLMQSILAGQITDNAMTAMEMDTSSYEEST